MISKAKVGEKVQEKFIHAKQRYIRCMGNYFEARWAPHFIYAIEHDYIALSSLSNSDGEPMTMSELQAMVYTGEHK